MHIKVIVMTLNTTGGRLNNVQFMMRRENFVVHLYQTTFTVLFDALLFAIDLHATALLLGFSRPFFYEQPLLSVLKKAVTAAGLVLSGCFRCAYPYQNRIVNAVKLGQQRF